ncbi:adenylate/guanylate cyclase domain-containing protein [Planococcus dechangensis]|uniref:DUF5939 domain-containing protein n=1 Tax=Planococcus dechangensis TaxID=1176255 RepID=A0ABV9M8E7_9BACL
MKLKPKSYVLEQEYPLEREMAWQLLADNNRMNDAIGMFPVAFQPAKTDANGVFYRKAAAKAMGFVPMEWQEFPFEWQEHEFYTVERRYLSGPLLYYVLKIELFDVQEGARTKIRLTAEFAPRNVLGYAAIQTTGLPAVKKIMGYLDGYAKGGGLTASVKKTTPKVNFGELERLSEKLNVYPVNPEFTDCLASYLAESADQDVAEIMPKQLAKLWGMPPTEVLRGLLYATKTGLLDMSWHVICPNCRVSKDEHRSLSDLEQQFHCDLCGVVYDTEFDQSVELHFAVHPTIRTAYAEVYCVGGPVITPHVKAQQIIASGETAGFAAASVEKPLRLRVLQANDQIAVTRSGAFRYTQTGWIQEAVDAVGFSVANDSDSDIVVALEYADWSEDTVTASKVTAMQEFRDLFSSEVLAPGQKIAIGHVTILFTDLKGSTALYEEAGDANAYGRVRSHFDFLTEHIKQNSGSVVKTIGDAVMAVFSKPADGVKAALAIQQKLDAFNEQTNDTLLLRLGLFSGPAIAVNSNDRLDYFGRTVNLAARVQGQGDAGEVIISGALLEQPDVAALLASSQLSIEPFSAELKGIEGEQALVRLRMQEIARIEAG